MLVKQRKQWRENFCKGGKPKCKALAEYRENRDSESWRLNSSYEEVCEYVMHLERQLEIAYLTIEKLEENSND